MSGPGNMPSRTDTPELQRYDKTPTIVKTPPAQVPEHTPTTITPPLGVTEKELFAFPGVNWLEFFRDNVVEVARQRLQEAHRAVVPLEVAPGHFEQADSIKTYFNNVKKTTQDNLDTLNTLLFDLQTTLTSQATKYKTLHDAMSATVDQLGMDFYRANGTIGNVKPIEQGPA